MTEQEIRLRMEALKLAVDLIRGGLWSEVAVGDNVLEVAAKFEKFLRGK
jgi:hypothetical protein